MCPTIAVDKHGDVKLAVGAAGGTRITTSTALVCVTNVLIHVYSHTYITSYELRKHCDIKYGLQKDNLF